MRQQIIDAFYHPYCVYLHRCGDIYLYVGSGTLARAFSLTRTDSWRESVRNRQITVEILEWFDDREAAGRHEVELIKRYNPLCNKMHARGEAPRLPPVRKRPGKRRGCLRANHRAVRCVETGAVYPTSRAAQHALGCSQTAFSNVLNGRGKSIRGFTFVRATAAELKLWQDQY